MNNRQEKPIAGRHEFREAPRSHLFWVLLVLFIALGTDYGFRLAELKLQHGLLTRFEARQKQGFDDIGRMEETTRKVQALSVELAQIAPTNAIAQEIVKEFGIQWTPRLPAAPAPPPAVTNQNAQTNK